jgi:CelD/BcsL family acetyltransferase involved in cellulose biosynthesis
MVYSFNPLCDPRWMELVERHPAASAFHDRGWLRALALTYGYEPVAATLTPPGIPLQEALVACRVSSWITGTRYVSLPFSDHCQPLVDSSEREIVLQNWFRDECNRTGGRYFEIRPLVGEAADGMVASSSYWFHELDLRPDLAGIFRAFHRDSIQRKISRAEREGLSLDAGTSDGLVDEFYRLLLITRRRHGLLPQPKSWFSNVMHCMQGNARVLLARKGSVAVAGVLALRHRNSVTYKYGVSDDAFHHFGAMPFLFWRLIEESKRNGAEVLDLGRCDLDNPGLLAFKDKLGTAKRSLTYYRFSRAAKSRSLKGLALKPVRRCFTVMPNSVFGAAGSLVYRHMG